MIDKFTPPEFPDEMPESEREKHRQLWRNSVPSRMTFDEHVAFSQRPISDTTTSTTTNGLQDRE